MFLVVVAGRCWYEKSRLNIHYYPNRRHKSYVTSLKAAIVGKSLISAELDIIEFWISFFMIKYSKFTYTIGTGNFTDPSCQNTDKFQNRAGGGELHSPYASPHIPARHALVNMAARKMQRNYMLNLNHKSKYNYFNYLDIMKGTKSFWKVCKPYFPNNHSKKEY